MAIHRFGPGNKAAVGRRQNGQGNPSKVKREIKRIAGDLAKKYVEEHFLKNALNLYGQMATGKGPRGGKLPKGININARTVEHLIERFIPPAPRQIDLGLADTAEDFLLRFERGDFDDAEVVELTAIEDQRGDDDAKEE